MKKTLKMLAMLMVLCLTLGAVPALAYDFPVVEEPITVEFWAGFTGMQTGWEDMYVWGAYEKKTNIHIDWTLFDWGVAKEQVNLLLLDEKADMPDAFYKTFADKNFVIENGKEGYFMRLNDLIDEYMPNYKSWLDKYNLWSCYQDLETGDIYSIGMIDAAMADRINSKIFLNKTWMENCGITKMPTTTEEFLNVLRAFRDMDANGNGDPNDEIPFTSTDIWKVVTHFFGCYDVANRGTSHTYLRWNEEKQDIEFGATTQNWRELLAFVHTMWEEGLLDPAIFNQDTTAIMALSAEDRIGGIGYGNLDAFISSDFVHNFSALPEALEGPYGKSVNNLQSAYNDYVSTAFYLSADTEYAVELCKWIDYFYTEEGSEFLFWGVEGDTFTYNEDGSRSWSEWVTANEGNTSYDLLYSRIMPWSGGAMPCVALDNTMSSGEVIGEGYVAAVNLAPYALEEVWTPFQRTQEERERNSELWTNLIVNHYDVWLALFVKGEKDINSDADWKEYCDLFTKYGVEEYMDIQRAGLARMLGEE